MGRMLGIGLVVAAMLATALPAAGSAGEAGVYLVTLRPGVDLPDTAAAHAARHPVEVRHVYGHALFGYAAVMSPQTAAILARNPKVASVIPDRTVSIAAPKWCSDPGHRKYDPDHPDCTDAPEPLPSSQSTPTGVRRIAATGGGPVDADVAVLDTGIDRSHPDLDVAGGVNCSSGPPRKYSDGHGHGTHVAGTIGAVDNDQGVVGVAPGARLWAVRVLDSSGSGTWSSVICGLDWVIARANVIEVVNMSLSGGGADGSCDDGGLHQAICNAVAAGITVVVAAGNDSIDAAGRVPAAYDEVITVSALADFDGIPGGLGAPTCRPDVDDTFADFSNHGADIDVIAPGVCIESTWKGGGYATISGTSMASPHVAGVAARYLAAHPDAVPAEVRAALIAAGSADWNAGDDPDGIQEPRLDATGF